MTTMTTGSTATAVDLTCDCRPDGKTLCLSQKWFGGADHIDALTNARLAGWGIRDDGAARCPACKATGVAFAARAAGYAREASDDAG